LNTRLCYSTERTVNRFATVSDGKTKFANLNIYIMAGYYPDTCDTLVGEHDCDPCAPKEYGRVRATAFIKAGFEFTNPESQSEWEAAIASGDVILIPRTHGSLPEPSENEGTGYGDTVTELLGFEYALQYFDPNYAGNCDFYNALKRQSTYKFMYKTSTMGHITNDTVSVVPKPPVDDDLNSEVVWNVTVKWKSEDHPCPFVFPAAVLKCFIPNN